jgi:homoaconitase/3-isopropylmalate dehydratase large subunit
VDIREKAQALGCLEVFAQASVQIVKLDCRACINSGFGVLDKEEMEVYAINKNFKRRSSDPQRKLFGFSRTVTISAVRVKISHFLD